jgi:ribosomal protein S18 acetylase RimI-like enzyme
VNPHPWIEIVDVVDAAGFERVPPCADARFDHRSCDYWEDAVRGSKEARPSWWQPTPARPAPRPAPASDNPFAPPAREAPAFNPFDPRAAAEVSFNPFAPQPVEAVTTDDRPRKLRSLDRGRGVFGPYAKVLLHDGEPVAYAQFGPLTAYPRAQQLRDLYPSLPTSPLPAVITCIATTAEARGRNFARRLIETVVEALAERGFSAVEAYPDLTLEVDEASAATPAFWMACGFRLAAADERFPVLRRELD